MSKTMLITGTSSGYGKATTEHFLRGGWNVVATMRGPDPDIFDAPINRLRVFPLDVTSEQNIAALLESGELRPLPLLQGRRRSSSLVMYINEERLPGNSAITALAQMFIERVAAWEMRG